MYRLNRSRVQACTGEMGHGARHVSVKWCMGPGMYRVKRHKGCRMYWANRQKGRRHVPGKFSEARAPGKFSEARA